jgi:Protein of unknown function (DUF3148)
MSQEFNIGTTIRLIALPPYLKTADPMPMMRSASLLELGMTGLSDRKPGNYWVVKFERGSFLLEDCYLEVVNS